MAVEATGAEEHGKCRVAAEERHVRGDAAAKEEVAAFVGKANEAPKKLPN